MPKDVERLDHAELDMPKDLKPAPNLDFDFTSDSSSSAEKKEDTQASLGAASPADSVEESETVDRYVRRLSSLGKLLAMRMGLSPCTMVSIVDGHLVISANVKSPSKTDDVAMILHNKMKIIRETLNEMVASRASWSGSDADLKEAEDRYLTNVLLRLGTKDLGGLLQDDEANEDGSLSKQAFRKLACTVNMDGEEANSFSQEDIAILLDPAKTIYLLPAKVDHEICMSVIRPDFSGSLVCQEHINFPYEYGTFLAIDKFHAEQLTALYVDRSAPDNYNKKIAGSLLCCTTCNGCLLEKGYVTQGTHGLIYEGTANLFEAPGYGLSPDRNNKRQKKLADPSPEESAVKHHRFGFFGQAAGEDRQPLKRSLVYSESEAAETAMNLPNA
jgi:hypothetical protein